MKVLYPIIICSLLLSSCVDNQRSIQVRILDPSGEPTAARVRITSLDGTYLAPNQHRADFPITHANDPIAEEADVMLDEDRRFAYVTGEFRIDVPEESIHIEVIKGFRYKWISDTIAVSQVGEKLDLHLVDAFDLPNENWYSGDVHVHFLNPKSAMLEMKGEDLNVCNVLISDFTIDQEQFSGKIESNSDPNHLLYYGQEFREDRLGHINLLNLKTHLIEPVIPKRAHQYPLNMYAGTETHKQGGHISWAHFAAWPGLEGPLGIVMKKVDAVELLCTIDPFHAPIFASDIVPDVQLNSGLRLWYRLLNCGLSIPATAGTDKMNNQVTVGANRVFAWIPKEFTYDNWVEALNQGRTFVSNSPFLRFEVNDSLPGANLKLRRGEQVQIHAEVWSQMPMDRIEIIANGELIAEQAIAKGSQYAKLDLSFRPDKSSWIAARAYQFSRPDARKGLSLAQRRDAGGGSTQLNRYFGTLRPETTFAHSSPVYVSVDEQAIRSKEDAAYFVRYLNNAQQWLEESGSFPSDSAKKEVLQAFEEGKQAFRQLETF